jgi:hypothetical protein
MSIIKNNGIGNLDDPRAEGYLQHLLRQLCDKISLDLAPEYHFEFRTNEEIRANADMLVFLGSTYQRGIGRNAPTVRYWRDTFLKLWDAQATKLDISALHVDWNEQRKIIEDTFQKLEDLATAHPVWWDDFGKSQENE